jgi:hypothetical protein
VQADIVAVLRKIDPDPRTKVAAEQRLRAALAKVIDKYSEKFRPGAGSKMFITADTASCS